MEEKYTPVCKGAGLFHSPKQEYSKETQKIIKQLLDESKLSIIQKKLIRNAVKNGDPIPKSLTKPDMKQEPLIEQKPKSSKRRSWKAIKNSGAYEREKFTPINNKASSKDEKERLQKLMEYGRNIPISETTVPKRKCANRKPAYEITKHEIFQNLVDEIEERAQFLEDMEKLGEGKKFKMVIENEIAQKLHQMEMLDGERLRQLTEGAVHYYYKKFLNISGPKSLPLTALQFPYQ